MELEFSGQIAIVIGGLMVAVGGLIVQTAKPYRFGLILFAAGMAMLALGFHDVLYESLQWAPSHPLIRLGVSIAVGVYFVTAYWHRESRSRSEPY